MLRIIFDTNIYGHLFKEEDGAEIETNIIKEKDYIVYGFAPIRKELRDIPKTSEQSRKTRLALLEMYNRITEDRLLEHTDKVIKLARKFHARYKKLGGIYGWHTNIKVDFMIVACASLHKLDVIFSADNKTLRSKEAQQAYFEVCHDEENLWPPRLLPYETLLKKFRQRLL